MHQIRSLTNYFVLVASLALSNTIFAMPICSPETAKKFLTALMEQVNRDQNYGISNVLEPLIVTKETEDLFVKAIVVQHFSGPWTEGGHYRSAKALERVRAELTARGSAGVENLKIQVAKLHVLEFILRNISNPNLSQNYRRYDAWQTLIQGLTKDSVVEIEKYFLNTFAKRERNEALENSVVEARKRLAREYKQVQTDIILWKAVKAIDRYMPNGFLSEDGSVLLSGVEVLALRQDQIQYQVAEDMKSALMKFLNRMISEERITERDRQRILELDGRGQIQSLQRRGLLAAYDVNVMIGNIVY